MSGRVFISHASQDHEVADAVCQALEARSVECWIAPRDITPGKEYAHALYDAIVECRALLLVLSANAVASAQVRREIEQASRDGDPIIAFRIDDVEPGPALEFHIGRVDWLASPTVDLATQIGLLAETVQAQLSADGPQRGIPTTGGYRAWRGYPGVLRRLTATWTTALIATALVFSTIDLGANVVAFYFARQAALAPPGQPRQMTIGGQPMTITLPPATVTESPFEEEDPVERIAALSGVQLILTFPMVFVWLTWLCSAYLTLEHEGETLPHAAARVPGRFLWRGLTFTGGVDVLRDLWSAAIQSTSAPRRFMPFTIVTAALVPLGMFTAIVAGEDEWSDQVLIAIGIVTDLVWLAAGILCLAVQKPIEKRLREMELDLGSPRTQTPTEASSAAI